MPRLPDLVGGYGVHRDSLPGGGPQEAEGWSGRCPAGPIVRYGMSRPRRPRGNLVKHNLVTDSPGGWFRKWSRRISARPGSPRY
jgi:hypothetical protein